MPGKKARKASKTQAQIQVDPKTLGWSVFSGFLILGLCVGFYFWDPAGWFAIAPVVTPVVEEEESTTFDFLLLDYYTLEEIEHDDSEIYVYGLDVSDLTDEQKENVERGDFSQVATKETGSSYTPDSTYNSTFASSDYWYYCKADGTDYVAQYIIPRIDIVNTIYLMNETEDVAIALVSQDEYSTTFVNTTYDEWNVMYTCLDDSEGTGEPALGEGYRPYGDFLEDADFESGPTINNFLLVRFGFNCSSTNSSWVDLDLPTSATFTEHTMDYYLIYEISDPILGSGQFMFDFDAYIGTTYDVQNCSLGYGTHEAGTYWDTY